MRLTAPTRRDEYLAYDYVGAPIQRPASTRPGCAGAVPVRVVDARASAGAGRDAGAKRRLQPAQPAPHAGAGRSPAHPGRGAAAPTWWAAIRRMQWQHDALLEDVRFSGVLRPALEAVGLRFAPVELARSRD